MEISDRSLIKNKIFDTLAVAFLFAHVVLLALNWHNYPTELDTPYHLLMGKMFADHGHIVLWDSYEFAPVGRPQLYPPLEHILIWFAHAATKLSYMDIGRVIALLQSSLGLFFVWLIPGKFFGSAAGLFSLIFFASHTECWWWQTSVAPISVITVLFLPFILLYYQKRVLGSVALLTACLYLHYGLSFTLVATILLATLCHRQHRREYLKNALVIIGTSLLLFSPWLLRLWSFRHYFLSHAESKKLGALDLFSLKINFHEIFLHLNFFAWLFALAGLWLCYRKKGGDFKYSLLLAGFWSYFVFLFLFWGVRFNAHTPVVIAPLAGLGMSLVLNNVRRAKTLPLKKTCQAFLVLPLVFSVFFEFHPLTPSLIKSNSVHIDLMKLEKAEVFFRQTPLTNGFLSWAAKTPLRGKHAIRVQDFFTLKETAPLLDFVRRYVPSEEIIHISNGALANYIVLMTGRRTDWGMYWEVMTPEMKRVIDLRSRRGIYISHRDNFGDLLPKAYVDNKIFPKAIRRFGRYYVGYLGPQVSPEKIDTGVTL